MYEDVIEVINEMIDTQSMPYGNDEVASAGTMWSGGYSTALAVLKERLSGGV